MPVCFRTIRFAPALAGASLALACAGVSNVNRDVDRTPIVNTGVGATILMPGETAPPPQWPGSVTGAGAPAASAEGRSGAAAPTPGSSPVTFLGGTEVDEERHVTQKSQPRWLKYAALPFAVAAYPFQKAIDAVRGDSEPGPPVPDGRVPVPASPEDRADAQAAQERAELDRLQNELAQRGATPAQPQFASPAATRAAPPRAPLSIAEELAFLREGRTPPSRTLPAPSEPSRTAPRRPVPSATPGAQPGETGRALDRDGDGHPDQWAYRAGGALVRELSDEDGDGTADRSVRYDPHSGAIASVEEDMNRDGTFDSWSQYADGTLARRRSDADFDGTIDTWTFYEAGSIARHEQDTNADGFRDRIGYYENGQLAREEVDRSGRGHPDLVLYYDEKGRVRVSEEDVDGDGVPDVRAHYRKGKLKRREILTDAALDATLESHAAPGNAPGRP
ncbi:MAG: hypothetical protein JSU66_13815 [Deltaproteobacteria bacterium]|nr:MAG: hypothetical protein JSU66_13815 [Deltaproteobacteria bacterium]